MKHMSGGLNLHIGLIGSSNRAKNITQFLELKAYCWKMPNYTQYFSQSVYYHNQLHLPYQSKG